MPAYSWLRSTPDEMHYIEAADGWRLALSRYLPRGADPHGEPVLLHHGLASSSLVFDLGVGAQAPSLAHWLADRGYDVWACDLRGSGYSERPGYGKPMPWTWSVDDFVERDDPAFLCLILGKSAYRNVHWIGHSLGGILLLCHCVRHGSPLIASGVAASAGLDFAGTGSFYRFCAPLGGVARRIGRVPMGLASRPFARLTGRWGLPIERFVYNPANISRAAAQAIHAELHDVSGMVLHQLASLFAPGGLRTLDGRPYADPARQVSTPILVMTGENDLQGPPAVAEKARRLLAGPRHRLVLLGKKHGQAEDYGHLDLFLGRHAEQEVYPEIQSWLRAHPAQLREDQQGLVGTAS